MEIFQGWKNKDEIEGKMGVLFDTKQAADH
jgi:hypothetical protein